MKCFNIIFYTSGGAGAGVGINGVGGAFNFGLGNRLGVNGNLGFTPNYVAASHPGYSGYYNRYYTPTTYYTPSPAPVASVNPFPSPSPPATYYARTLPNGVLLPLLY